MPAAKHRNPNNVKITPVRAGDELSLPTNDGSGYTQRVVEADGLYFEPEGSDAYFVTRDVLEAALAELSWPYTSVTGPAGGVR